MKIRVDFDAATASKVADYFETSGQVAAAVQLWQGICTIAPYDRAAREKLASLLFLTRKAAFPPGTLARSHALLDLIWQTYPTKLLHDAYFKNLEQLMTTLAHRAQPGHVVIGLGTGRCGSTTLAAALGTVQDVCATHENPPTIYWEPLEDQISFHTDRFRLLSQHYALVFDASHWWLNVVERFFAEFPAGKAVGLCRDTTACVNSFMQIKGSGRGSINHWAAGGSDVWASTFFDPTYPSYPVDPELVGDVDLVKAAMIERYVVDYNQKLRALAKEHPDRVFLMRTEELNDPGTIGRLGGFLNVPLTVPRTAMNVRSTADSDQMKYRL